MTAPDRDEEFTAFLQHRTILPDPLGRLEPSAQLDQQILEQARQAIHAQSQPARAARWARPMALAATILLCLSIVLNVTLNTNRRAGYPQTTTAAGLDEAAAQKPESSPAPTAASARGPVPAMTQPQGMTAPQDAMQPQAPAAAQLSERARRDEPARQLAARAAGKEPESGENGPASSLDRSAGTQNALSAGAAGAARGAGAASTAPESASASVTASTSPPSASPPPPSPPSAAASDRGFAYLGPPAAEQPPALEMKRKADAQQPHPRDPKVWLQQIEALRAQGKTAQADAEMQRFRAAFPTYPAAPATAPPGR